MTPNEGLTTVFSAKSSGRRKRLSVRFTAVAAAAAALSLVAPAAAHAAPVTVWPNGPVVEVPEIQLPPLPGAPTTPKKEKPTTPETPGVPAMPNVSTPTGWVALASDNDHTIYWWKDGRFVKKMPISMGSDRHPTPNGVYRTMEKYRDMIMDSSTYGVPIDSPDGYRTEVEYAVRMSNSGIFIHAAPWSVAQQGKTNVSHGCINVSTENGKWIYENIGSGTPIVVRGTVGGGNQNTNRVGS